MDDADRPNRIRPERLCGAIKQQIQSVDKDQPISSIKPMTDYLAESIAQRRFNMFLLGVFAALALLLAAIGIYGVVSYSVAQRTREFGIRIALGAGRSDILTTNDSTGDATRSARPGIGLVAAVATTRLWRAWCFRSALPIRRFLCWWQSFSLLVALIACVLPAFRASRVDPMVALRYE